ncbi:hypothetical protein Tco_0154415 [Tanacetum coccineum]
MTTLAEFMILFGADNRPPMLDKDMYDSWKSIMELYMQNREHGIMILESVEHGLLICPKIEENGLPSDVYSLVNHHRVAKDLWEKIQVLMQVNQQTHLAEFPQIDFSLAVPVFKQGDDPIDAINKMMSFLVTVQPLQGRSNSYVAGEGHMTRQCPKPKRKRDATWFRDKVLLVEAQGSSKVLNEEELEFLAEGPVTQTVITHNASYQADDLDAYDSDCDEISIAKAVLMANFSSYVLDVLFEVPHSDNTHNDMLNQSVQEMSDSEQTHLVSYPENEITTVRDTNSSTQQDAMILSVFEQLSNQVTNCNKVNKDNLMANESLSAELERYKERVEFLEERQNMDLKTFNVLKNESKEKETKNIDKEIALQKKVKELDNIVYKMGQSAQTVHMLAKPQVFYDNNLKQALGFQNPFYLKKAQQIRPILYDDRVIAKETNLNRLSEDFGKCFVPQQELSDEQALWLQTLHPNTDQSASSLVTIEAPRELPKERPDLLKELTEVQIVFNQMEAAVQQYFVDRQCFEIQKKQFLIEKDQLLDQIISQDIVNIVVHSSVNMNTSVNVNSHVAMNDSVNYVEKCNKCLELEAELIKQHNMNDTSVNQTEPAFHHLFELNNLKAELQAKDTTIEKLKANSKRLNKTSTTNSVKKDIDEIETINIELEHREKVVVITSLENDLRKLKGKNIVDNAAQVSNATTIALGMYKLDPVTLAPKDKINRETHIYYLQHTMEQAAILREIVEQAKSLNPLDSASYSTCKYVKLIQELLGYVRDTCPDIHKPGEKLVVVTPINKKKIVSSMFDARHELCFLEFVYDMNATSKSKSNKKAKKKKNGNLEEKCLLKLDITGYL